jgi:hypothetical protein
MGKPTAGRRVAVARLLENDLPAYGRRLISSMMKPMKKPSVFPTTGPNFSTVGLAYACFDIVLLLE